MKSEKLTAALSVTISSLADGIHSSCGLLGFVYQQAGTRVIDPGGMQGWVGQTYMYVINALMQQSKELIVITINTVTTCNCVIFIMYLICCMYICQVEEVCGLHQCVYNQRLHSATKHWPATETCILPWTASGPADSHPAQGSSW